MENRDIHYMRIALETATAGAGFVSPNPMVGAVIVSPDDKIIGRGAHLLFGGPHAEVNAVNSVVEADRRLFPQSTIYVTLEPCSHFGKTPPCALLLRECGFKRVVVGAPDPNPLVAGRGVAMLREAGIEVTENVLLDECIFLNRRFMTAQTLKRPYILLKWAQSADGFISATDADGKPAPAAISNPVTKVLMHRQRALYDAILVGSGTILADNPSLTVRLAPRRKDPVPVIFRSDRLPADAACIRQETIFLDPEIPLRDNMRNLFENHGISSIMIEGGSSILSSFIAENLFDEIRVETNPSLSLRNGVAAPALPQEITLHEEQNLCRNIISTYFPKHPQFNFLATL